MSWNRNTEPVTPVKTKSPSALRGIIAGAVVVVCAGVCFFLFSGKDATPKAKAEKKPSAIREVVPSSRQTETKPVKQKREEAKKVKDAVKATTTGEVANAEEKLPSHCITSFRRKPGAKKPLFDDPVRLQLLEYIYAARDVPPPCKVTDDEALNACIAGAKYEEGDTPEDRAVKDAVGELLKELKQWLRDGKHANDFFQHLQSRQEMERDAVETARREILDVASGGNAEETKAAMKAYNKFLRDKGLPEVKIVKLRHLQREVREEERNEQAKKQEESK